MIDTIALIPIYVGYLIILFLGFSSSWNLMRHQEDRGFGILLLAVMLIFLGLTIPVATVPFQ